MIEVTAGWYMTLAAVLFSIVLLGILVQCPHHVHSS